MPNIRRLLPAVFTVCLVGLFAFLGVNSGELGQAGQVSYITKELPSEGMLYIQPRFSSYLDLSADEYFKGFDIQALGYIVEEELAKDYAIKSTSYHTHPVHGNEVPGLFVFLDGEQDS
ncbi:MAG: hypothetical protein AAF703_08155 [Cyanobacteria bacterium P01_D01_bin.105]